MSLLKNYKTLSDIVNCSERKIIPTIMNIVEDHMHFNINGRMRHKKMVFFDFFDDFHKFYKRETSKNLELLLQSFIIYLMDLLYELKNNIILNNGLEFWFNMKSAIRLEKWTSNGKLYSLLLEHCEFEFINNNPKYKEIEKEDKTDYEENNDEDDVNSNIENNEEDPYFNSPKKDVFLRKRFLANLIDGLVESFNKL